MGFDLGSALSNLNPNTALQNKGRMVAGGTGPVRVKKGPGLIESIIGVFVGILLVLASPVAMWMAQSQHSAKDFATAKEISATDEATGYVVFRGEPEFKGDPDLCYAGTCIWERMAEEEQVKEVKLECSNSIQESDTVKILRQNGSECDDDSGECVPCYDVERKVWKEQGSEEIVNLVTVGRYTISPKSATLFDTKETIEDTGTSFTTGNKTRNVYTTFEMPDQLLVAGEVDGDKIVDGEKPFVMSAFDREATLAKLKAADQQNMVILFVITFGMLFIGYSMILGPLTWMGRQLKWIPGFGRMLVQGSKSIIGLVAFLLAVVSWIIIWVAVVVLKFWWLSLIIIGAGIGFAIWKSKKSADEPAAPAAPQQPQAPQNPAPPAA